MKKKKAIVKESRRVAKKELKAQIIASLASINISKSHKKANKLILKAAKQLAKGLVSYVETKNPVVAEQTIPVTKKVVAKKPKVEKEETTA
jgi:hypothetical protein